MLSKLGDLFSFGGGGTAVGVSIGSSSIKIVELVKTRKAWKLLHFGVIQLGDEAIVNREIVNRISIVEALRTLLSQMKLKTKQVTTAISGTSVIIKRMSVQVENQKEMQDQIFWEAEQYLPFDVSEVVMDYQLLSDKKDKKADVILVAAKSSVMDEYVSCLSDSGLKTKIVDVDYFALQNLFEANYSPSPSESVCLVDIGASSMKLVIVHRGIPVYTKDTTLGGKNLTQEIQKHLNLSFQDAETLKCGTSGSAMPQEVSDLMSIMAENMAGEIKRTIDFYEASSAGAPVAYVLLAGGSSKVPNLSKEVEEQIRRPVQIMNPFNAVNYDPGVFTEEYIRSIAPVAAVPVGLAMRMGGK